MMKTILCAIFAASLFVGCTRDFTEISRADLDRAFIINSSPTFKGYFYLGSDINYHYFRSKWKYRPDEHFKILKSDFMILKEEELGQREVGVFPYFKPTIFETDPFGSIGQTELYREK